MFTCPVELGPAFQGPFVTLDAIIDSGAFYSQAPASMLRELGVEVLDRATFVTADGRRIESDLGQIILRIDGRVRQSICVFGEEGTPPLLGSYALEGFMLGVDPVHKKLMPVEGYLL